MKLYFIIFFSFLPEKERVEEQKMKWNDLCFKDK